MPIGRPLSKPRGSFRAMAFSTARASSRARSNDVAQKALIFGL